jgi:hypothetical protein
MGGREQRGTVETHLIIDFTLQLSFSYALSSSVLFPNSLLLSPGTQMRILPSASWKGVSKRKRGEEGEEDEPSPAEASMSPMREEKGWEERQSRGLLPVEIAKSRRILEEEAMTAEEESKLTMWRKPHTVNHTRMLT